MKRGREPAGWPHIREGTGARPENPVKGNFRGGFLYTARPSPACRRALHPAAPGERDELWEELLTTKSTKEAQRNTEKNINMKNSVALCETSVSSVVKKEITTEMRLGDFAPFPIEHRDKVREKDFNEKHPQPKTRSS